MAAFDYSALASVAVDILTEFGRTATLQVLTANAYTASTSTATKTYSSFTVVAVVLPVAESKEWAFKTELVAQAESLLYVSAVGVTQAPGPGSLLTVGGRTYVVLELADIAPAGTSVLFVALCTIA
jgi:hypothetical protein